MNYDITDIKESLCDNSKQLLSKDNEMYKKIYIKNMETYFTHDNGGRPFMAVVNGKNIDIYKVQKDNDSALIEYYN